MLSSPSVAAESTVSPTPANCCSRCERLTVSPTSVYSSRSAEPSRAAAASPVDSPSPSPNGGRPSSVHSRLISAWSVCIAEAAASAMHTLQAEVNLEWTEDGLPPLGLGLGLSTGEAAAALLGSAERLEYTLVGD